MSTSMKGNDHVARANSFQGIIGARQAQADLTVAALSALTEATLAVAHEQRMNTLATILANGVQVSLEADKFLEHFQPIARELKEGTGL